MCDVHLTEREREIALLIAEGLPRKQVASRLGIAPGTVDAHLGRLSKRLPGNGRLSVRITRFVLREYESAA